jgi:hypothetical protein
MLRLLYESSFGNTAFDIAVAVKLLDCVTQLLVAFSRSRTPRGERHRRRRRPPVQ